MLYSSKTVLYVDDTIEQRYAMRRILESGGYEVLEANTGAEALQLMSTSPMAVILDVRLPDMNGYDVCRSIKSSPISAGIPVLQVSAGFAEPSLRVEALSGGADAYIAQPVHPQELLNLLRATVQAHRSEKMLRLLAGVGLRIASSLDLNETVRSIRDSVIPVFCDCCHLYLLKPSDAERQPIDPLLQQVAEEAIRSGTAQLTGLKAPFHSAIAAPLDSPSVRLGAILFVLDRSGRRYSSGDLPIAQDLAARIALAVQNARLHTEQQAAQAALVQSEKIAAAGRLSAAIAHEINNPLEAVVNMVYLMDACAETPSEVRKYAQEVLSELSRIAHITRQTLGFYRELGGVQEFDLSESVQETLTLLKKRITARDIIVHESYAPSLRIRAVKGEIRQVVSNLILNAIDAMEPGGVLKLETSLESEEHVMIRVKDTGRGIPLEQLIQIFDPFFTTKKGMGTGLGLWVSQRIVNKHGGEIRVRSQTTGPGHGTTMEVILRQEPDLA